MDINLGKYFDNGQFEMARSNGHTLLRNNMDPLFRQKIIRRLIKKYPVQKRKIDRLVRAIRKKVAKCDPVQLLSFSSDLFMVSNINISSEFQLSKEDIYSSRITEYVQSIIVSTESKYRTTSKDQSKAFFRIQHKIEKLYSLIDTFYFCWAANLENLCPDLDPETRNILRESQYLYTVRGQRYQIFELEYFEKLLGIHDDGFNRLFGLTAAQVIEGIEKLQFALSQGKMAVMNHLHEAIDSYLEHGETSPDQFAQENAELRKEFIEKFLGTKLRDVIEVTGWTESFVESLSFGINESPSFFSGGEFAGWPIIDLPVQKRPFIKIDGRYYCFDYYSFMDNFYRAVQKAIRGKDQNYNWNDMQKEASESMVANVFSEILPGCTAYRDNYYPINKSLKNLTENDIIIKYSNVLIIVEVKAGAFVYTPPITDFENHIKSYRELIEKANHQCKSTYDYLLSRPNPTLHNRNGSIKAEIDMSKISDIFMMTVTMDNINDFAARAEKLNFLQLKCNAISLSIDDLMVYREYFDSPLVFLHFLRQRRQATQEEKLALNDELDHLGLYIKHNMYCLQLRDYPSDAHISFQGYREELDQYFGALYHPELHVEKPALKISEPVRQFVEYLTENDIDNKVEIADYLLSFSTEAEAQLCQSIRYALNRQRKTGNMLALGTAGDEEFSLRYTCFVEQPRINVFTDAEKRDYVLSTLLWNNDPDRVMLEFCYDGNDNFKSLHFTRFTKADVRNDELSRLEQQGKNRASMRIRLYLQQHGHIGEDEICPCGSGKIYRLCCGNRS